jgi:hypothetical protein
MDNAVPVQTADERSDFVYLLLWGYAVPVLGFWVALWASTQFPIGGHTDGPAVFPYQLHVAAAVLVPLVNGWVFLPTFRRRASVVLAGFAIPVLIAVLFAVL